MSNINQIKNTSLTLLYIEDTPQTRESTTIAFKELFDNIIIAIDGEDGFNKFKENKIDIVITDINLPKLNGIGMIKKIRDIDPDVSIVIISAYNNTEYLTNSMALLHLPWVYKHLKIGIS